jgi:hypothetical protein
VVRRVFCLVEVVIRYQILANMANIANVVNGDEA